MKMLHVPMTLLLIFSLKGCGTMKTANGKTMQQNDTNIGTETKVGTETTND